MSTPVSSSEVAALASALDAVDRGTLALSLSYAAPGSAERLERARASRAAFSDALEQLDDQEAWGAPVSPGECCMLRRGAATMRPTSG